jgi:hypothetical protein
MVKSMKTNMVSNSDKSIKQSLIKLRYKKMISSKANTPYKKQPKDKTMTIKQKKEKLIQYMKKEKDLKPYVKDIQELNNKSFSVFLKIAKSLKQ